MTIDLHKSPLVNNRCFQTGKHETHKGTIRYMHTVRICCFREARTSRGVARQAFPFSATRDNDSPITSNVRSKRADHSWDQHNRLGGRLRSGLERTFDVARDHSRTLPCE
jgi:hypothetical protein